MRVLQTEQCNTCTLLRNGQLCNHLRNQRHQTLLVPQHQLISLARMMSHHEVSHGQAMFHGICRDIYSIFEVYPAHVNLYCLGHDYSVALLFVGILFLIQPHNHDSTPTRREQRDRTVGLQLYLRSNQQYMLLHCSARTQRASSSSATV